MLIVSKWHDYYDVGMKQGIDKTVVYERIAEVKVGKYIPSISGVNRWDYCVLAFCGKFYPFVYHNNNGVIDLVVWEVDRAIEAIRPTDKYYSWRDYSLSSEQGIRKFFDKKYPEMEEMFHTYRTPAFLFTPRSSSWHWDNKTYSSLMVNPVLKEIQFYKVMDPITTFQEISMFISGVIGSPPRSFVAISNKVKAQYLGHDGEFSFRKPPGKRGKNRWR